MRVYDVIETSTRIYVISEYLSGGQLFEKLAQSGGTTERLAARYLLDIILALNYCHKRGIIHRRCKISSHPNAKKRAKRKTNCRRSPFKQVANKLHPQYNKRRSDLSRRPIKPRKFPRKTSLG